MRHADHGTSKGDASHAFAVYVHWPFCAQKCPYCDFNSHVRHDGWDEERFSAAYIAELRTTAARIDRAEVASIFFGGGTPSLMQPRTTATIIDEIARLWPLAADCEITLEANPGSVEAERFRGYRSAGVNRVSLGVQSLRDDELRRLGRVHTVAEAHAALEVARSTFDRWSFDLIYARPRQTAAQWRVELLEALALSPRHLSLYQLTIEEGTPFAALHAAGKLVVPADEEARALYELTQEHCERAGLLRYEVSNHAVAGEECRHNLVYWSYGTYAGVGPGAHGRVMIGGKRHATVTERAPEAWATRVLANGHGVVDDIALDLAEQADERLIMGLRLRDGLSLDQLAATTGLRPDGQTLSRLEALGYLSFPSAGHVRATAEGAMVLNSIVAEVAAALRPVGPISSGTSREPVGAPIPR